MAKAKRTDGSLRATMKKMFSMVLQEIVDMRLELKNDIAASEARLSDRIDRVGRSLSFRIDTLEAKFDVTATAADHPSNLSTSSRN